MIEHHQVFTCVTAGHLNLCITESCGIIRNIFKWENEINELALDDAWVLTWICIDNHGANNSRLDDYRLVIEIGDLFLSILRFMKKHLKVTLDLESFREMQTVIIKKHAQLKSSHQLVNVLIFMKNIIQAKRVCLLLLPWKCNSIVVSTRNIILVLFLLFIYSILWMLPGHAVIIWNVININNAIVGQLETCIWVF